MLMDFDWFAKRAAQLAPTFQGAAPFPHLATLVRDTLLPLGIEHYTTYAIGEVEQRIERGAVEPYRYSNALEEKTAIDKIERLPSVFKRLLQDMNDPRFLHGLEQLTGIDGLIPDPYYRGGGLHRILPGGKLDVHIDFNIHPRLKLYRRLNVILYLNASVPDASGDLQLWSGRKEDGRHELTALEASVPPLLGMLAVFATSEHSYHGHPDPLTWTRPRYSLATYYYTAEPGPGEPAAPHSTVFIRRPHEGPEHDALRAARAAGRLTSNVTEKGTA